MLNIFEDQRMLDDLIVGYCMIFNGDLLVSVSWDFDPEDDFTNDSYYDEMEQS